MNDIQTITITKYKTPDGKLFDSNEEAEIHLKRKSEDEKLKDRCDRCKDICLVNFNFKIPRMLKEKFTGRDNRIKLQDEIFELYKVKDINEFVELAMAFNNEFHGILVFEINELTTFSFMTLTSKVASWDEDFINQFKFPMLLLRGKYHMNTVMSMDNVLKKCEYIKDDCKNTLSEMDEFIERVHRIKINY